MNKVIYDTMIKKRVFRDNGFKNTLLYSEHTGCGKSKILSFIMEDLYAIGVKYTYINKTQLESCNPLKYLKDNRESLEKIIIIDSLDDFHIEDKNRFFMYLDLDKDYKIITSITKKNICRDIEHEFKDNLIDLDEIYKNEIDLLLPIFKNDLFSDKDLLDIGIISTKDTNDIINETYPSYRIAKGLLYSNLKKLK